MSDVVLERIQAGIRRVLSDPALKAELSGWKRTARIKVGGDYYALRVENDSITVQREKTRHFDVEVKLNKATFLEIVTGKLPFTTAYLRGLLTVKGDVSASDITKLQKLL